MLSCRASTLKRIHGHAVRLIALVMTALFVSTAGHAQTNQYTNTTAGAIVDSTNCATTVTRTFNVPTSYTVGDVNLGVFLNHTYRSDLRITLTSPGGTTVSVMTNTGGSGDNLNDLFDDEAAASITTHVNTGTDSTSAPPPYSHSFQPSSSLSAFDGQNAAGNWRLVICDSVAQDTGNFIRADLYITQQGPVADLSLSKSVSNANPSSGAAISYTLTVANAASSSLTANGVVVRDLLPAGFVYVSHSGGTYNSSTGDWTVGSLAPGASATLTINGTVSAMATATVVNTAEIIASSANDSDSTVNNGITTEDDYASRSFTVAGTRVAGTPPTLVCTAGSTIFDWDSQTWSAGSTSASYTLATIGAMNWTITNQGVWLNNATYGGQSPAEQTTTTGGLTPVESSLIQLADFASISQVATTTITLGNAAAGAQFRIFDVDYNAGQFADRVMVTGSLNGTPVTPTLTNGAANYVIGNSAYGDVLSTDTSANGNVWVTFTSAVDTIVITYSSHSLAPANPGQQAVSIHDITMCNPNANLTIDKSSTILADGVNSSDFYSLPGARLRYCILITNTGGSPATAVTASDTLPANMTYVPGSMRTGTSCSNAATVEDEDNAGADESDPDGMQLAGTTISGSRASLVGGGTLAFTFEATVN